MKKKKMGIDRNKKAVIDYYFKEKKEKEKNIYIEKGKYIFQSLGFMVLVWVFFISIFWIFKMDIEKSFWIFFLAVFIWPILEELFFRKGYWLAWILSFFHRLINKKIEIEIYFKNKSIREKIADFLFIILHFVPFVWMGSSTIWGILSVIIWTLILREAYRIHGIYVSILIHILNNFIFYTLTI
jgi:hypothetical protein